MNYAGKFDATIAADGPGTHHSPAYVHFDSPHAKIPPDAIVVTDAHLLFNADFKRSGVDLILSKDDAELVLHDYFKGEKRAPLASPDGAHLTGDLVNALTGHVQYSQAGGAAAASHVIGHVTKLAGSATAIRNGVSILLHQGDNVEKGDVVQSGADSTLGITFIDGTVFGLSSNARMVLNEMVYDPNGSNNASLMSLVAGTISFVAGETAKHGDMKIDTPVATMGIRGTAVLVEIDFTVPQGASQPDAKFQVLVEPDGTTGSYILFDKTTLQPIAVVNQAGQQVSINNGVVSTSASQLSPDLQKLITDVFAQKFAANDSNTKLTQHTDSTNPDLFNGQLIKTASGATATPVFLVTGTALGSSTPPGQGNGPLSGLQHVDQAPVVTVGSGTTNEILKTTHSTTPDLASNIITFNDINVGDQPTATTTFDNYTYTDAHGNAMAANPLQLADVKATEVNLVVVQGPDNTNTGQASWTYLVPDKAFDFLAAGETLTLTYIAEVDSNYAPNNLKTLVPFTITVTGTNDVPVITTGPESVEFFAAGKTTPGGNLAPSTPTTGTLAFTDVDLTDTHTVAPPQLTTATLSGSGALNLLLVADGKLTEDGLALAPSPLQIFENALSATVASDSTGSGSGTINWTLADLPVYLADFIPKGETLTLTYTVTVTDSQNTTSTQNVIVTITGDNAPAVVWIETTNTVATDTANGIVPGDWNAGTHWETGNVPTANDDTIIITNQLKNLTPFYPVTIDAPAFAKTLTMNDFGDTPPILDNNSTLTVGGTFDLITDAIVKNSGTISVGGLMEVENASQLTNSGALALLQLAQGGDFKDQSIIKNNAGATIEVSGGALNVRVNIDNSGGFLQVDDGAALTLNGATVTGGTVTDNGTINVTGDSAIDAAAVNGGQLTVDASTTLTLDDTTVTGTKITDNGTVKVDATKTLTLQGGATVTGGALGNSGTVKVESSAGATLDGVKVTGSGNIQVDTNVIASALVLDDGTTVTGGTLTVGPVGTLAVETAAGATLNDVGVTNNHSIEVFAGSNLTLDAGTAVTNNGTVSVDSTATLVLDSATVTGGTVTDNGAVHVTGDSAINGAAVNGGQLTVDASTTLTLDDTTVTGTTITDNGTVKVEASKTLNLSGVALSGGAISNLGTLDITGDSSISSDALANHRLTIDATKTLTLNGTTVTGGIVTDSGAVHVTGDSAINGAAVNGGQLTVDATKTLTLDDTTVTGTKITDNGTVKVEASKTLKLSGVALSGGAISNLGILDITGDSSISSDALANHQLTVDATKTLTLQDGATVTGGTLSNSGTVMVEGSSGATLDGVNVTGSGNIQVDTNVIASTLVLDDGTTVTGGTLTVGPVGTLAVKTAAGATLNDVGVTNNHSIEVFAGSILTLDAGTAVTNSGAVTVDSSAALVLDSATINGGTLNIDGTLDSTDISAITNAGIHNTGTIEATSGILTIDPTVAVTFTNSGTIEANGGELDLIQQTVSNGGTLEAVNGGLLVLNNTTVNNTGGTVEAVDPGLWSISTVNLQGATINGGIVATISDGIINATGGINAIDGAILNNAGTLEVTGGTLTIDAASTVNNAGVLEANGGSLIIDTAFSGSAEIIGASFLELGASSASAYSSANITFAAAATGTLQLDHAETFHGTVSGLDDNTLDLRDIAYGANGTASYAGTTAGGILSILVGGVAVSNIHLSGDYTGVHWALTDDGATHGTDVKEIPGAISAGLDSNGNASEGSAVTAIVTDGGQSVTGITYDWQIFDTAQKTWIDGSGTGVNSAIYTPGEQDEGHALRVSLTFTDANAQSESSTVSVGTVNPVADQPLVTASATATNEDSTSALTITLTNASDLFENSDDSVTVTVSLSDGATLYGTGVTDNDNGTFTLTAHSAADLSGLTITPASEFEGNVTVAVSAVTHDGTAASVAGTTSATLTVIPVADQPVVTASAATINEDGTSALTITLTNAADLFENSDDSVTVTVTLDHGATLHGTGVTENEDGSFTLTATSVADLSGLTITPASEFEGTVGIAVSAIAHDGTAASVAGTTSASLTVNPVADQPVVTASAATINEDGTSALTITLSNAADLFENSDDSVTVTVTLDHGATLHGTGVTDNGDGSFTLTATSVADLSGLTITPASEFEGTVGIGVSAVTHDGAAASVAGTTSASLTVNPVADQPVVAASAATINEDGTSALTITLSNAADLFENSDDSVTVTVTLDHGATLHGTGVTDNHDGSFTLTATSVADLSGLTITPASEFEGTVGIAVSAVAHDGTAVSAAGITSTTITVNPVAEAPSAAAPATLTLNENATGVAITGVSVGPPAEDNDDTVSAVLTVGHGTLHVGSLAGVTVTNNGTASVIVAGSAALVNTLLAGLTYTPTGEYEGTDTLNLSATSTDGANTFATPATASTSITVNPVAEAPSAAAPATLTLTENATSVAITGVSVGPLAEDSDDSVSAALTVGHGALHVDNTSLPAGVTVTGDGSGALTISGGAAAVNTLLAGLTYTPATEFNGSDSLHVTVTSKDGSNTSPTKGTASTAITVNDGPNDLVATLDHTTAQQGVTMHVTGVKDGGITVSDGVSYKWQDSSNNGSTWQTVGTGSSFTPGESDEGKLMQLVVTYVDAGGSESSTYNLGMPNDLTATLDSTTAQQGETIHVTSVDDGGTTVSRGVSYAWQVSSDGGQHWTTVGTNSSYTPVAADGGELLQVVVNYVDSGENESTTDSLGIVASAKEWKGDAHEWQTPGQWSPSGVPTPGDNAVVDVSGTYKITVDQSSSVAHSLVVNDSGATVEIVEGGALTLGGNLTIQAGKFQIDAGGTLKDIASSATIIGAFTDNGTVEAGGGTLEIASTAISGSGKFKIDAGATLQLDHADSLNVAFTTSGTLVLKDPAHFTGTISDSGGSLTSGDVVDLAGFDTSASLTYSGTTSSGTVTVSEAGHTTAVLHVGANSTHWNAPVTDNHGGILIHDPPDDASAPTADGGAAPASGSLAVGGVVAIDPGPAPSTIVANAPNQTLTGSSASDTFVFNFIDVGHNTVTNFHPDTDTLQFSGTIFANAQAALNATQDDGHGNTVVALDAHDTITLTAVLKAQLHTADFHFV